MSLHEYEVSRHIDPELPFYALIMAAMRRADDSNLRGLQEVFPAVWYELQQRYDAPGGRIPGDPDNVGG